MIASEPQSGSRIGPGHRPGPKPRLSRKVIISAAVESGLETVTMQSIAARLGSSPSALYRYFDNRDTLVVAAIHELLAELPMPSMTDGWRAFLAAEAELRWDLLMTSAGLATADPSRFDSVTTQRMVSLVDALTTCGFSVDDAVLAVDGVLDLVHDGAAQASRLHQPDAAGARVRDPQLQARLDRCSPPVRAALERIVDDPWAHVHRKLTLLLDGMERRMTSTEVPAEEAP